MDMREAPAWLLLAVLVIVDLLSLIPGMLPELPAKWAMALTLMTIGLLALKYLLELRPYYQPGGIVPYLFRGRVAEGVSLDGVFYMQVFIGVLATFAYLGMLFFCLIYASAPVYAELFNKLLTWSIVPGLIWGFFFGQSAIVRGIWPSRRKVYTFIIPLLILLILVCFGLVGVSLLGIILIAGWVADHWGDSAGIGVIILLAILAAASIAVTFILIVPKP
jgi:hypothetical protein